MIFSIDRALPVPIGTQLRGLVEYGIACGELSAGSRLPSVRGLAELLGIAPMTVSQVYRELHGAGLIETRPGHGTFVAASMPAAVPPREGLVEIRRRVDRLIADAAAAGLSRAELAALVNARLSNHGAPPRGLRLVLVGVFERATQAYAALIQARLPPGDSILGTTFERVARDEVMRRRLIHADLALTFANRRAELQRLLGARRRAAALSFIPAERTRMALAELDPMTRLGIVSTFPEFLPIMKTGVARHAPHVAAIRTTILDGADLPDLLPAVDVVVYATGAERVLELLPAGVRAIEYRHVPDPRIVDQMLLPLLDKIRAGAEAPPHGDALKEAT